jgi:phosphate transporter
VIPLFVTAMIIPFFIVVLGILGNDADGTTKTTKDAVDEICHAMFSPVILLLLGGFSIAAALSNSKLPSEWPP